MLSRKRPGLKAFGRDQRGLAAVEFALIAPAMILLYCGLVEVCQAIIASRKTDHVASAVADLVTQADAVTVSGGEYEMTNGVAFKVGSLSIDTTGRASVAANGNRTLYVDNLNVGAAGTLDLNDNDLVVNNGNFTTIYGQVLAAFGAPSSPGITSSTSDGSQILALFDNALIGAGDWNGEPIGANAVVGKYTYFGDVDFDGQVTGDDYTIIDSNLNTTPATGLAWLSGDANLDGIVTGDDYTTIDSNLGLGVGNPLSASSLTPSSLTAVPEPATLLWSIAGAGLLALRRRRA